jgi:Ca-activated chloride channel family protein
LAAATLSSAQTLNPPSIPSTSQSPHYDLSVDVNLVNVTATVLDESGRYLDDLTTDDFQVLENGQTQKIAFFSHDAHAPISLGVLIDGSGSLQDKFRQSLQIVSELAGSLSSTDEMFVMTFNSRVELKQQFTNDSEAIERSLTNIHPHGETAVYDAISAGLLEMQKARYPKRILLLISDGFDTRSKIKANEAEEMLRASKILFYAIGIDDDDNAPPRRRPRYHIYEYMLRKLTGAAGGDLIRLYTGRNYDLGSLSQSLLGTVHQQYTLGYYPAAATTNGGARNIEIRVAKPGARIRCLSC